MRVRAFNRRAAAAPSDSPVALELARHMAGALAREGVEAVPHRLEYALATGWES